MIETGFSELSLMARAIADGLEPGTSNLMRDLATAIDSLRSQLTAANERILELEHLCGLMVQTIRPHFPSLADSYAEQFAPTPPPKEPQSQPEVD